MESEAVDRQPPQAATAGRGGGNALQRIPGHVWLGLAIGGGTLLIGFLAYRHSQAAGSSGAATLNGAQGIQPDWLAAALQDPNFAAELQALMQYNQNGGTPNPPQPPSPSSPPNLWYGGPPFPRGNGGQGLGLGGWHPGDGGGVPGGGGIDTHHRPH